MSNQDKREEVPPPPIPKGCKPLSHQVAGHVYGKCKTRAGLLQDDNGSILKLLQTNNRGHREKKFYKRIFDEEQDDPVLLEARDLLCPFRGTVISAEDPSVEFIKLRDMTIGYQHPCIMDIKIGRIGYAEEGGDPTKAQMAKIKYPDMEKLGFQVLGMRVYHPLSQKYALYDKKYGKTLNLNTMIEGLAKFFNVEERIRTDVMYAFLVRLQQILDWFQVQKRYHFYSSSLLFIYEGALLPGDVDDNLKKPSNTIPHSSVAKNPLNGTTDGIFNMKSDTYPHKRKKSVADEMEDADNTIRGINRECMNGFRETKGCGDSRLDDVSSAGKGGTVLGSGVMHNNNVMDRHEPGIVVVSHCVDGNASRTEAPSTRVQGNVDACLERTISADFSDSTNSRFPTQNHSTQESKIATHTNHKNDHCNMMRSSRKDSHPPHKGTTDQWLRPVDIRMIDFAHAIETTSRDENYIFGLKMLKQYIETLHNCYVG